MDLRVCDRRGAPFAVRHFAREALEQEEREEREKQVESRFAVRDWRLAAGDSRVARRHETPVARHFSAAPELEAGSWQPETSFLMDFRISNRRRALEEIEIASLIGLRHVQCV